MSTITRRSIRRAPNSKFEGLPTLAGFVAFLAKGNISYGSTGRPFGSRVFVAQMGNGAFLSATFAHPTKRPTRGRLATLSWRNPRSTA
jgi:fructose-1,6-bisphosphatase/inositol monophosphatase family enzyme